MKLKNNITLEEIEELAKRTDRLIYSVNTCWWKVGDPVYIYQDCELPCDPRGGMLMETDKPLDFIKKAKENPSYYGKHRLDAFVAAYHGNLCTDDDWPTSFDSWDEYNQLLDEQEVKSVINTLKDDMKKALSGFVGEVVDDNLVFKIQNMIRNMISANYGSCVSDKDVTFTVVPDPKNCGVSVEIKASTSAGAQVVRGLGLATDPILERELTEEEILERSFVW